MVDVMESHGLLLLVREKAVLDDPVCPASEATSFVPTALGEAPGSRPLRLLPVPPLTLPFRLPSRPTVFSMLSGCWT